jgi:hypothetical protein
VHVMRRRLARRLMNGYSQLGLSKSARRQSGATRSGRRGAADGGG